MKTRLILLTFTFVFGCTGPINKEAASLFQSLRDSLSVTVYPVHVIILPKSVQTDTKLQNEVVMYLNSNDYAHAVTTTMDVNIPVAPSKNQAKMFKESALNFAQQVSNQNISTPYALLVETLSWHNESNMGGIHYYVADTMGHVVAGGLTNSHWEEFISVSPRTRQDGIKVAFNMLDKALSPQVLDKK